MSQSSFSSSSSSAETWQRQLQTLCTRLNYPSPNYELLSDRRGGRTAWSCRVEIKGVTFPARFWYDGRNVDNAREDAAQVAYSSFMEWIQARLTNNGNTATSEQYAQVYARMQ